MKLTRRRFFNTTLATYLAVRSGRAFAAGSGMDFLSAREFGTLTAFVDTLIPADRYSPAASALGVPEAVVQSGKEDSDVERVIRAGCRWLDRSARSSGADGFAAMDEPGREAIVAAAAAGDARPLPKAFFRIVHQIAMRHYYAQTAAWSGLGYEGPPQPEGFMSFDRPPPSADR